MANNLNKLYKEHITMSRAIKEFTDKSRKESFIRIYKTWRHKEKRLLLMYFNYIANDDERAVDIFSDKVKYITSDDSTYYNRFEKTNVRSAVFYEHADLYMSILYIYTWLNDLLNLSINEDYVAINEFDGSLQLYLLIYNPTIWQKTQPESPSNHGDRLNLINLLNEIYNDYININEKAKNVGIANFAGKKEIKSMLTNTNYKIRLANVVMAETFNVDMSRKDLQHQSGEATKKLKSNLINDYFTSQYYDFFLGNNDLIYEPKKSKLFIKN